jgi:hypothetical protein
MTQLSDDVSNRLLRGNARIAITTDELDRQLRRAEALIRRRAFGVSARVVLRTGFDEEGGGEWQESLCFGEIHGRWCLFLESGFADRPESLQRRELFASNIDTRSLAAKKLPVLVQALEAVELEEREDVASVARELAGFVDHLSRSDD